MTASSIGIIAAFIAFLSWGVGDFAIQRAVRRVGNIEALFFIGALGSIVLLPIVWSDIPTLFSSSILLLTGIATVVVTMLAAIFDLEALKRGKLSVIEPIMSFELLLTALIGIAFLGERLTIWQTILSLSVFIGILLTSIRHTPRHWWQSRKPKAILEQGVILAAVGALFMSMTNALTGVLSQQSEALLAIWWVHSWIAAITLCWFAFHGRIRQTFKSARTHWKIVSLESVCDNAAWIAYAVAVTIIPISITIAITESYIALATLLGVVFNRERLQRHQALGSLVTIICAILLAISTSL